MEKGDYLAAILRSPKTVFSLADIALLWNEQGTSATRARLSYYAKNGDLYRIRRGLYSKDKYYDRNELATRIFTPAYVSFETILAQKGVIFQFYSNIFIASYLTREIMIDEQTYTFKQMKHEIITNQLGVEHNNESAFATKERAFLDTLYINTDYHFDNLGDIQWDNVFAMLPLYENKNMIRKVNKLQKEMMEKR
jgi:predicted transcriptional regulator of viral defense system